MRSRAIRLMLACLFILPVISCDRYMVFDEFHHLEDGKWGWDEPVRFDIEMADTTAEYNILIQLRHTTNYPMSNLYMFVDVSGPSGQAMRDTIQFILARPDGKWVGRGSGKIRQLGYLYKQRTRFPEPGTYRFSIEQAMRSPTLPVVDVGLRIEQYHSE